MHELLQCNAQGIEKAAAILRDGGVLVFPTDTVYGIGCDPYDDSAVARVFSIKGRDEMKALPVLVRDLDTAQKLVELGPKATLLASRYWPGGLTIVAPLKDRRISKRATANSDSLAVRMPSGECISALLHRCSIVVGTSANLSNKSSASSASDVMESGMRGFDALLDGGPVLMGLSSTIIQEDILSAGRSTSGQDGETLLGGVKIIREGAVKKSEILSFLAGSSK